VFVVTELDGVTVVAYYAWRMAELALANVPERLKKSAGKYPQPIALLARLGVDERYEGKRIEAALLSDVIRRTLNLDKDIGSPGPAHPRRNHGSARVLPAPRPGTYG